MAGLPTEAELQAVLDYLRGRLGSEIAYRAPPRRLTGGFVTDVYAFELTGAPPDWSVPLVLRVYPGWADASLIRRERCAQDTVAAQGFPAPRVLLCEEAADAVGRPFMVMDRMPGRPLMGGADFPTVVVELPRILRMPARTARVMLDLHALDAAALIDCFQAAGMDRRSAGPDHWLGRCEALIDEWSLDGLRAPLGWLRAKRPEDPPRPAICHGDLWGANILAEGERITGVLDWNLVTIADPAFEIGGQLASLQQSPIIAPFVIRWIAIAVGRLLARRLRSVYEAAHPLDDSNVRYYAVLRAFGELTFQLAADARIRSTGVEERRATWRPAQCARYIRRRTGVRVRI